MPYHCLHTNTAATYEAALAFISTSLQTIGWTLYDDVSATEKIFTSSGENGNFTDGYIRIHGSLYFEAYMWWNNSTHTGTGKAYSAGTYYGRIYVTSNNSIIVYGDKNAIVVWSATSSADYTAQSFGYLTPMHEGYTVASGISQGSTVTVDVDDTSCLLNLSYATIIGTETEGRDRVYISSIPNDTQIVISSTPRSYAEGAKIGHYPCPFFLSLGSSNADANYISYVCGYQSAGTANSLSTHRYEKANRLFDNYTYFDPDSYSQRYLLQPYGWEEDGSPYSPVGYLEHFKYAPVTDTTATYYNQHLYCVNSGKIWMGAPSSSTSSGIVDVSQSWETNGLIDKIIVVSSGPGLGQTRRVVSNTESLLVIGDPWDAIPDGTSTYELHDEVYRNIYGFLCMKEIVD